MKSNKDSCSIFSCKWFCKQNKLASSNIPVMSYSVSQFCIYVNTFGLFMLYNNRSYIQTFFKYYECLQHDHISLTRTRFTLLGAVEINRW